jgi:aspartate aminotransferase
VLLAGGRPVIVETQTDDGFVPTGDLIKNAVTSKTKAIIINSPGNPTGAVYPRQVLKEIGALAIRHNLHIISDEIYEKLVYDGAEHVSIASLGEDVASRTITINGVSKTFAMTGWRIGWSVSPPEIAANISKLQDQVTSNAATVSQYAALAALQLSDDEIQDMVCEFDRRRMTMLAELAKIPGVRLQSPRGAFYAFANFESAMADRIQDDCTLAELLLDSARVACVPGSVFGGKGHLRLSYTLSPERISLGVAKIAQALESLR